MTTRYQRRFGISQVQKEETRFPIEIRDKETYVIITSPTAGPSATQWWLRLFHLHFDDVHGDTMVIKPSSGVEVEIVIDSGELKISGDNHWDWFMSTFVELLKNDFAPIAASRPPPVEAKRPLDNSSNGHHHAGTMKSAKSFDTLSKISIINDAIMGEELIVEIPAFGAVKDTPRFVYPLWKGVLSAWLSRGSNVTIAARQLDPDRLVDICLILRKHRQVDSTIPRHHQANPNVRLLVPAKHCDGKLSWRDVRSRGKRLLKAFRTRRGSKLLAADDIQWIMAKIVVRQVSSLQCSFVSVHNILDAEVFTLSAALNKADLVQGTTSHVWLGKMTVEELKVNYFNAAELHTVSMDKT